MSSPGVRQMVNGKKAQKAGFETNAEYRFFSFLNAEIAAAYTYGEDLTTNTPLAEIAPMETRFRIHADFRPVKLSFGMRNISAQNRINEDFGELTTKRATLFDFIGNYAITSKISLEFRVENILNKAYSEHLTRTLSTDIAQRILAPGRNFALNFSYLF